MVKKMASFLLRIDDSLYSQVKGKALELSLSVNNYLLMLISSGMGVEQSTEGDTKNEILNELKTVLIPQLKSELLTELTKQIADVTINMGVPEVSNFSEGKIERIVMENSDSELIEEKISQTSKENFDNITDDIEGNITDNIIEDSITADIEDSITDNITEDNITGNIVKEKVLVLPHKYLLPSELAKRLKIHKNNLTAKWRNLSSEDFAIFTQALDPEHKAWYRVGHHYSCDEVIQNLVA